jgi:cysteine desulfurase / selenocysteine lyase
VPLRTDVDWRAVRAEFPALEGRTYLNTATFGQLPKRSVEAAARHFARRDETLCGDFLSWFDDIDQLRRALGRLIGAGQSDIAFIPNAASALALLLNGLEWKPGDRILTLKDEFPNNIYSPALLARRGVEFIETTLEDFYKELTPAVRLVVLSEVSYMNGRRPPLEEISRRVHELGGLLYVDGTQSLGALRFNVRTVEPDMFAVHGYKWLLSPNGAAFMYLRPSLRERIEPVVIGWRSHKTWREVDNLHHGAPEFVEAAEKYEGGMLAFAALYAMQASVEMILELGPETVERRVLELADYTRAALRRLGARLPCDEQPYFESPIVAACFDRGDASALARELHARRVHISARHGLLRISTHFYNTEEDVDRLAAELKSLGV